MTLTRISGFKRKLVTLILTCGVVSFCGCGAGGPRLSQMKALNIKEYTGVSKAFRADMPSCAGLRGTRVYTSFTTDLSHYTFLETREMPNTRWVNTTMKIKEYYPYVNAPFNTVYDGDLAQDFTALVNHILVTQCGAIIVDSQDQADVSISGYIKKFHSQIIDKVDKFDDGWNVYGGSVNMKIGTILSVESELNNTPWIYEELLNISDNRWYKVDKSKDTILLGGVRKEEQGTDIKTYLHNDFLVSQSSHAGALQTTEVVMLRSTSSDAKNSFQIYNDDDGVLIQSFKDIDHVHKNTSDYDLYNQYRKLYTTGFGNLIYLVNDYTKKVMERIFYESR